MRYCCAGEFCDSGQQYQIIGAAPDGDFFRIGAGDTFGRVRHPLNRPVVVNQLAVCRLGYGEARDHLEVDFLAAYGYPLNDTAAGNIACESACGNGLVDAAEGCDDGNLELERCDYGVEACTVCDSVCQPVAGATSFCGDGRIDARAMETWTPEIKSQSCAYGERRCQVCAANVARPSGRCPIAEMGIDADNGEGCDDGNNDTEALYGEEACEVCDTECALVPGQTVLRR